jgi:hypothetical protein
VELATSAACALAPQWHQSNRRAKKEQVGFVKPVRKFFLARIPEGEDVTRGKNDKIPLLEYATLPCRKARLGWLIGLGIYQVLWIAVWTLQSFDYSGPKQVVRDSFSCLMVAAPSLCAVAASIVAWRHLRSKVNRSSLMIVCISVGLISATILGWLVFCWITEVLLDPHGQWRAL